MVRLVGLWGSMGWTPSPFIVVVWRFMFSVVEHQSNPVRSDVYRMAWHVDFYAPPDTCRKRGLAGISKGCRLAHIFPVGDSTVPGSAVYMADWTDCSIGLLV